jgi:hypothetical protein
MQVKAAAVLCRCCDSVLELLCRGWVGAAVLPSRGGACAAVAWHAVLGLLFGVGPAVLGLGLGLLFVAEAGRRSCVADAKLMLC